MQAIERKRGGKRERERERERERGEGGGGVCVCVCEKEKERERVTERQRQRLSQRHRQTVNGTIFTNTTPLSKQPLLRFYTKTQAACSRKFPLRCLFQMSIKLS